MRRSARTEVPLAGQSAELADIKRKSVRGGVIALVSQGVSVIIGLASTVVLARALTPEDYGVVAMVVAVASFAGLFRDLGLSSAVIQIRTLTSAQQSNLFWLNVALGSLLTLGFAGAAPLVASFYQRPEVLWVMVALSTNFLIGSLATQSGARLVREMRFGRQALASISGALVNLAVAVPLALRGSGYWSLVWGQVIGGFTTTCLLMMLSPFRPGLPSRGTDLGKMIRFGAHITAFDVVNYFHRNLDNVLIGRYWGAGPLGLYSRAYSLLIFPINNLRGPINSVAFPALSRLQDQPEAFRAYYLRATSLLAFVSMPLAAFLFAASSPVVELILGRQWLGVAPLVSGLALAGFIQPVSGFAGSLMMSLGQGRRYLQCGTFNALIYVLSFLAGLPWGPIGVALAYAAANYITLYPWLSWAYRDSSVSFRDFLNSCALPAISSIVSAALVVAIGPYVAATSPIGQISIAAVTFAAVNLCALCLTHSGRAHVSFAIGLLSQLRRAG